MSFWLERKFNCLIKLSSQLIKQIDYPNKDILLNIFQSFDSIYYEQVANQIEKKEGVYWENSFTSEEIIDCFYGIDFIINYRGYIYAIDITNNLDKVKHKQNSKNIKAIKKALDADFVCICYWDINPDTIYTQEQFSELIFKLKNEFKNIKDINQYKVSLINL